MTDQPLDAQPADDAPFERVRIMGGPLDGNEYAVQFRPGSSLELKALAGTFVYQFSAIEDSEPLLHYVGPAPPQA